MAKTILIPIDFRVESLNTLKFALAMQETHVDVILLYGHQVGDSINELLFYSPNTIITSLTSPEFEQAIMIIGNRYATNIQKLSIELLTAPSSGLLRNVLEHHAVQTIYLPKSYKLKPPKKGFDPTAVLRRSGVDIQEINWTMSVHSSEQDQLDSLFNQ